MDSYSTNTFVNNFGDYYYFISHSLDIRKNKNLFVEMVMFVMFVLYEYNICTEKWLNLFYLIQQRFYWRFYFPNFFYEHFFTRN